MHPTNINNSNWIKYINFGQYIQYYMIMMREPTIPFTNSRWYTWFQDGLIEPHLNFFINIMPQVTPKQATEMASPILTLNLSASIFSFICIKRGARRRKIHMNSASMKCKHLQEISHIQQIRYERYNFALAYTHPPEPSSPCGGFLKHFCWQQCRSLNCWWPHPFSFWTASTGAHEEGR